MTALSMQKDRTNGILLGLAIIAVVMMLGASAAFAGADTTFNTALTKFTGDSVWIPHKGVDLVTFAEEVFNSPTALRAASLRDEEGRHYGR